MPAYPARSALNWVRNEAPDDRTWSIELPAPDAGFLTVNMDGSGEVTIHSQADTEGRGDLALDQEPMGTGPFRFVGHTDDENFIFERFDDHYNPIDYPVRVSHVPHHRRLTGLVRPELQSRLAGLEAGEIDVIHEGVGVNAAKPYIDDPDYTVQFQPGAGWSVHNIYPNLWQQTTPDGDPNPFLDIRVRQAANHAINRRAIIDNLFLGVGDMSMLVYSGVPGYPSPEQKAEVVFDYNVEKAKQLMAEAGYEDGFDVPLYYTPDWGGDVVADLVLVASQDLAQIGIRVTPVPTLGSEYFTPQYSSGRDAAPWGLYWFYANAVPDNRLDVGMLRRLRWLLHHLPASGSAPAGALPRAASRAGSGSATRAHFGVVARAHPSGDIHLHRRGRRTRWSPGPTSITRRGAASET